LITKLAEPLKLNPPKLKLICTDAVNLSEEMAILPLRLTDELKSEKLPAQDPDIDAVPSHALVILICRLTLIEAKLAEPIETEPEPENE